MKYLQKIMLAALLVSTTAHAQVTKPVILSEDTSSSYITAGLFTEVDGQIEMVTQVRGFGIGYVVMDTTFKVVEEHVKPNYEWAFMPDAHKLSDGGYWISGYRYSFLPSGRRSYNVTSLKIDELGNLVWKSSLGDTSLMNFGGGSVIDQHGNIVISGSSRNIITGGYMSVSLTRFDSTGNLVGHDLYNRDNLATVASGHLSGMDVASLSDGNFVVLSSINTASTLLLLIIMDQQGDTLSTHKFAGFRDRPINLAATDDGHFYALSKDIDPPNYREVATQIWKFTNTGELVWEKSYTYLDDQGIDQNVVPHKVKSTSDGGCVVLGSAKGLIPVETLSSIHVAKFSPEGDMQWEMAIVDSSSGPNPEDILQLQDGSYILSAVYEAVVDLQPGQPAVYNYYARLSPDGTHVATTSVQDSVSSLTVQVSPNPFTDQVEASFTLDQPGTYTARLYDLQGRAVQETSQQATAGAQTVRMNTANLATGQYVLRIQTGDAMWSGKVVKR